jgi:hypothetical protein
MCGSEICLDWDQSTFLRAFFQVKRSQGNRVFA